MQTVEDLRKKLLQLVIESERYSPEELKRAEKNINNMRIELLRGYIATIEAFKGALGELGKT